MNISIIIFSYNERESIENVILSVKCVLDKIAETYEVIVVDDGSTDGTIDIVKKYDWVKTIVHSTNKGIGQALRSGYDASSKEFVCAVPGDGQFDVRELLNVEPFPMQTFYSFYRLMTNYSIYRSLLNLSNRIFNRWLLGISLNDVNWIKVYKKDQLDFVEVELKSSIVESEICAKLMKAGIKPVEVASIYHDRKSGKSKGGNWNTLRLAISEMVSLFIVVRRFKKKL